jgi:tripeptidyl-peptidase-1
MHNTKSLLFVTLAAVVAAIPASFSHHALHEKRTVSSRWEKRDRVHGEVKLPMRIGLTQSNLDKGYEYLMNV